MKICGKCKYYIPFIENVSQGKCNYQTPKWVSIYFQIFALQLFRNNMHRRVNYSDNSEDCGCYKSYRKNKG